MKVLLQQGLAAQAEQRGEAIAVVHQHARMTYRELDRKSTQLAHQLRDAGCRRGDRVCVLMPKSLPAIVGILGIVKADCAYVPIDPQSPAQRVRKVLDQCEPRVVLAGGQVGPLLDEVAAQQDVRSPWMLGWLGAEGLTNANVRADFTEADSQQYSVSPREYENCSDDPAYIMFTSGSTGVPKGVVITHANVGHYLGWAINYFGLTAADKMSSHPPLHFDLSVMDIFGALAVGAELHLVPQELNLLPNKMMEFIRSSALTHWFSVPSLLNYMAKFDVVEPHDCPTLKRLLWCGEVFPTPALMYWMKRLPHVAFTNLYGPTEATIASSYYTVPDCPKDESVTIPIGTACDGEELLVLDESLQPRPVGQMGDLYIKGVGLSPGYWKDPEKTASVFMPDPADPHSQARLYKTGDLATKETDGLIYFHGRSDTQVKSRGYRIELGDIEAALHALPMLDESAVVALEAGEVEGVTICCAYVAANGQVVTPAAVKHGLRSAVPPYMIPSRYLAFDRLPKNASGKIDRPGLRERFRQEHAQSTRSAA
jgi:amino acid adenylation domain-containing protein